MKHKDNAEQLNELYPEMVHIFETTILHDAIARKLHVRADVIDMDSQPKIVIHFELGYVVEIRPLSVPDGKTPTWFMDRLPLGKTFRKADMIQVICSVSRVNSEGSKLSPFVVEAEHPAILLAKVSLWIFKTLGKRLKPIPNFDASETDDE